MAKVSVTREKLDTLAEAVGAKSGEAIPLTIDEMTSAVLSIPEINNVDFQVVTPTESAQLIVPTGSYTGLTGVGVEAIPSNYIGSSINLYTSSDVSVGGSYSAGTGYGIYGPDGAYLDGIHLTMPETTATITNYQVQANSAGGTLRVGGSVTRGYTWEKTGVNIGTISTTSIYDSMKLLPSASDRVLSSQNFLAGNITIKGAELVEKTVTPTTSAQYITPNDSSYIEYSNTITADGAIYVGRNFSTGEASITINDFDLPVGTLYSASGYVKVYTDTDELYSTYTFTDVYGPQRMDTSDQTGYYILWYQEPGAGTMYSRYIEFTKTASRLSLDIDFHYSSYVCAKMEISIILRPIETNLITKAIVYMQPNATETVYRTVDPTAFGSYDSVGIFISENGKPSQEYPYRVFPLYDVQTKRYIYNAFKNEIIQNIGIDLYSGSTTDNIAIRYSSRASSTQTAYIYIYKHTEPNPNYYGLSKVIVNPIPSEYIVPTGTTTITSNGTHDVSAYASANVNIPSDINNQAKSITPTESVQTISADSGYSGLSTVTVGAISSTYVGSGITQRDENDITISQREITVPGGYYDSDAIATIDLTTAPTVTVGINASGVITATATLHEGYIEGGNKTATLALNTQTGTTITPKSTAQTAVGTGYYTTGTITVAAVPTETKTVTVNGTYSPTSGKWFSSFTVNVPVGDTINNQNISVTPTESQQTFTASSGYTGLGTVTVAAIPSTYVGSGIATRSANDVTSRSTSTAYIVDIPSGYYDTGLSTYAPTATLSAPTLSIANATGVITATASTTSRYYSTQSVSNTLTLTTQAGKTVTPGATSQTAVASYRWTTGTITVAAVPTDTNNSFSANGTYTPESGKWFSSVTVDVPSDINNQAKTATPTTATQTIKPDSNYSGLSQVTINPIPSNYITTSDANATASHILINKTAYVNGSKVTGSMPDNGATGGTITAQGGTYSIPAGYTSGGTVTASLPVSTITNGVLNVATITEATNDYGVEASITIPAGYYNTTTLSRILSNVLPMTTSAIAESQMLSGYEAYDYQGKLLTGTMTNRGAWNATLNDTITSTTIPAGYHNGSGTVSHATVNIPDPTFSMNNSTGVITASGTWTKGFTTDNSYSNTYSLTTQAGKTVTPTESAQTAVAANRWTTGTITVAAIPSDYVGSGITTRNSLTVSGRTVTALAGYYASTVTASVATMTPTVSTTSTGSLLDSVSVTTVQQYINLPEGYNTTSRYIRIWANQGQATGPSTVSGTGATVTPGTNALTFSKTISITPVITTTGYISAGTATNATVTLTATVTTKAAATYTPGTATQTIAANQYLTGAQTIAGDADLVAGNIKTGVNIFGVTGTYAGLDTSDATATASDIIFGETAYVDGEKITGTLVVQDYYTGTTSPSNSLGQDGDIYLRGGLL